MNRDNPIEVPLTDEELARIDALLPRFSTATYQATREDVLRALTALGLDAMETGGSVPQPPVAQEG